MRSKIVTRTFFHLLSFPASGLSAQPLLVWLRSNIFFHFLFFIFLSFCSTQPYVVETTPQSSDSARVAIYIVNHGWHTGIIIPSAIFFQQLPELQERFADAAFLEIGWGDKGFYQADEITFGLTMNAILWPTETVVHVVALPRDISSYFSDTRLLCISESELSALSRFLANSFDRDSNGDIIQGAKGIYGNGQFYKGSGSYHLFNTCNKWTAKGLQSAGFNISPSLKITAESIMRFVAIEQEAATNCQ